MNKDYLRGWIDKLRKEVKDAQRSKATSDVKLQSMLDGEWSQTLPRPRRIDKAESHTV